MTTFIPMAAKRLAAARPMPEAAPVITAARPGVKAGCCSAMSSSGGAAGPRHADHRMCCAAAKALENQLKLHHNVD